MSQQSLSEQIVADIKDAMRAKDTLRTSTLRMLRSELLLLTKTANADEQVTDSQVITIVEKLIKQRKDSANQFRAADREELAQKEELEASILAAYLPEQLSEDEISTLIDSAFAEVKPETMRDMGKIMAILKPQLAGRADMGQVSQIIKSRLQ